ncbi:putative enzyme related to lactoylglutathione lyase [Limimaricola variabilis]|uniref:Enzyme related to lactoylglutathione lyase n=1 Tax=Limimaricola variabilis TaxID=1492771 RepID=A0ABR6HRM8_9RHOB|nr:VOC family protein [Limimaricola variabilis]MBB3713192.1 putative enzyme related to lactoylglutathione lyase [Limimaricola variabilis]
MEKVTGIGGVFFRARDPEALAKWYLDHLGIEGPGPSIWRQEAGPTVLMPFAQETDYFGRSEQQWMINFRVADLDAMVAQLDAAGIAVERRDEWDSEIGRFARIHDPEGNPIELWQPAS